MPCIPIIWELIMNFHVAWMKIYKESVTNTRYSCSVGATVYVQIFEVCKFRRFHKPSIFEDHQPFKNLQISLTNTICIHDIITTDWEVYLVTCLLLSGLMYQNCLQNIILSQSTFRSHRMDWKVQSYREYTIFGAVRYQVWWPFWDCLDGCSC